MRQGTPTFIRGLFKMRYPITAGLFSAFLLALIPAPSLAAPVDPVNRAIDRGTIALKQLLKGAVKEDARANPSSRGIAKMGEMQTGVTALAVLTALECGIAADDPLVQRRLPGLRKASITVTQTYSLAVLILMFDRLADPDDVPLIYSMTLRLIAGQYYVGGWSYYCPPNTQAEIRRLSKLVKERPVKPRPRKSAEEGAMPPLPADVQDQLKRLANQRLDVIPNAQNFQGRGDNSNTQFAVLALWVARRYGFPVGQALATAAARFRKSQNPDGGWGYVPSVRGEVNKDTGSTPSMTCAGLMVLGLAHGTALETAKRAGARAEDLPDLTRDPSVRAGFGFLAGGINVLAGPRPRGYTQNGYYYLWSIERVGVGYNLRVIGNRDWYQVGATLLVASQGADGSWQNEYGPVVDTCFALLFLKRANLVKDLTKQLSDVQSLGEVMSKSNDPRKK
jgi:hypothetical protein